MLRTAEEVSSVFPRWGGDFERALHWSVSARSPDLTGAILLRAGLQSDDAHAIDGAAGRLLAAPGSAAPDARLRGTVLLALASTHFWHGAHDDVDARLRESLACAQRAGDAALQAEVLAMTACADAYRVRPGQASDAELRARRLLRGYPGLRPPPALRLAAAVGSVLRADLAAAARVLRAPGTAPDDPATVLWRATVLALAGRAPEAATALDAAGESPWPGLLRVQRDTLRAGVETALGRPRAAQRRLEPWRLEPWRGGTLSALADLARGRARLALNDLAGARQCVHGVVSGARPCLSRYVLVDAMLLDAVIAVRNREPVRALELMTNALDVADGDLVLPFALARGPLGPLLARHFSVSGRWPAAPDSLDAPPVSPAPPGPLGPPGPLASAANPAGPARAGPGRAQGPPLRLTQRERSVLAYLTTSLTAGEIADELYLSVNTVKTHLAAIYRKLGVAGRRPAVHRARELELL